MPDFSVTISSGASLKTWTDGETPSRLNPLPSAPHKYWAVAPAASSVRFSCTVDGTFEPMDAALGGRLFRWEWVESPYPLLTIPTLAGQSSVALFGSELSAQKKHHLIKVYRPYGGSIAIPFIVE